MSYGNNSGWLSVTLKELFEALGPHGFAVRCIRRSSGAAL